MRRGRLKGTAAILDLIERDPSRGKAFWWLYSEYDQVIVRAKGNRIRWKYVLAEVRRLGLTNANGQPVSSADALKKTFGRVAALKRREAEAKQQRAVERRRPTNDPPPLASDAPVYG